MKKKNKAAAAAQAAASLAWQRQHDGEKYAAAAA